MSTPVFSRLGFINWAEKQDPETKYDYTVAKTCVMTRYFRTAGIERNGAYSYGPVSLEVDNVWNKIAQGKPWTIGGALARAKETMK